MSAYRSAAMVVGPTDHELVELPHHEKRGPFTHCAGCGTELRYAGHVTRGCQGGARVIVRWWPWPRRCAKPGPHVHQRCGACGFRWTVDPKGATA